MNRKFFTALVAAALLLWAPLVPAATRQTARNTENQAERAQIAADVLAELMKTPDKGIPEDLLESAEAIAVVPNVVKAAFGIGGQWGKGLMAVRQNGRWSPPCYIDLSGGSFGFQIGGQSTDLVLVFTDKKGIQTLLSSKLKLGADASVAAGPVGRHGSLSTDLGFDSAVYSYSRSKGLFAGVALDGAVISVDDSANHKVYGPSVSGSDILLRNNVKSATTTAPFIAALNRYSPRYLEASKRHTTRRTGTAVSQTAADARDSARKTAHEVARDTDRKAQHESREIARADVPKNAEDQAERAQRAAVVLDDLVKAPDRSLPRELLDRAYGIAVIPNVVKAAFGVGGRWGKGLLSVRENGTWSAPAFIELGGGSVGFQIGAQSTDLVLVFTEKNSVRSLLSSKVKLGADASVAAGPVGRGAEAGTDAKLNAAVYSYSRSKGLFAGIALDGAVISMDDSANRKVYGERVTGEDILIRNRVASTPLTTPFTSALRQYSPRTTK
jgi:lipid-binding SYLF domain-containing protein